MLQDFCDAYQGDITGPSKTHSLPRSVQTAELLSGSSTRLLVRLQRLCSPSQFPALHNALLQCVQEAEDEPDKRFSLMEQILQQKLDPKFPPLVEPPFACDYVRCSMQCNPAWPCLPGQNTCSCQALTRGSCSRGTISSSARGCAAAMQLGLHACQHECCTMRATEWSRFT